MVAGQHRSPPRSTALQTSVVAASCCRWYAGGAQDTIMRTFGLMLACAYCAAAEVGVVLQEALFAELAQRALGESRLKRTFGGDQCAIASILLHRNRREQTEHKGHAV